MEHRTKKKYEVFFLYWSAYSLPRPAQCYNTSMPNKAPKKYAIQVVPLIPLPLQREPSFTYEFPEPIEKGSLVRIPFVKRSIQGVVIDSSEMITPLPFKTRPVSAVVTPSFLTSKQIALAEFISETYFTPLGIVLKHAIPKAVTERKKKDVKSASLTAIPALSPSQKKLVGSVTKENRSHSLPKSLKEKNSVFLAIADKITRARKKQILILVPDMMLAHELFEEYKKYFDSSILALITSNLPGGAYFTYWEAIRSGQARIIIGTRQALFAPFHTLQTVILDFDGHDGYKQWDMMPRYEGRIVAEKLAELHQANFITISPTPTLLILSEQEEGSLSIHGEDIFENDTARKNIILSDLKLDRYKKNFSPFSLLTLEHIRETLKRGRQILLIVNRQGTSIFSVCDRCKNVLRCPNCERALIGTDAGSYRCLHCAYRTKEFPSCPSCGGINFKNVGFGTEKLERELKRLFSYSTIRRVDATSRRLKRNEEDLLAEAHSGKIDILIGTESALLAPSLPKLGLIAMLDGDNALRFPDYQAEERLLRSLAIALGRISGEGKLIIQTFHSEHAIFRALIGGGMRPIIDTLKEDRTMFSYPPYGVIIKCSINDPDEKKAEQEIRRAASLLETPKGEKIHWNVSDPVIPLSPKIRGKYVRFIIVRIKGHHLPESLRQSLAKLSSQGFTLDRNPLSLS